MDNAVALQWNTRSVRSKRPRPPHADEYEAAMSLLLLSESGGGFCTSAAITTADPTISPPKTHQEVPHSALIIRIKRQKTASPDTPLPPPIYACSMCDEVFQCSRALGGHMTVHRAKKGKAAVSVSEDHQNSAAASTSARAHECSLCHETFGTGQALGGHMRKHFDKSKLARKSADGNSTSCSGESSDGGASTSGAKQMIDLNLLPPPE